jgi:hypothetical protein
MDADMHTTVEIKAWRFTWIGEHTIDVENNVRPYQRLKVPTPPVFDHRDLPMFARGWVACREYA